jgi:hypothetical protein
VSDLFNKTILLPGKIITRGIERAKNNNTYDKSKVEALDFAPIAGNYKNQAPEFGKSVILQLAR